MTKKALVSTIAAAAMVITAPVAGAATPETQKSGESITYLAKGKEYRSKDIDGFWKCMSGRSGYSLMGYGVSLTCHKHGDKWYFNYWDN